jgi:hypothetical protein
MILLLCSFVVICLGQSPLILVGFNVTADPQTGLDTFVPFVASATSQGLSVFFDNHGIELNAVVDVPTLVDAKVRFYDDALVTSFSVAPSLSPASTWWLFNTTSGTPPRTWPIKAYVGAPACQNIGVAASLICLTHGGDQVLTAPGDIAAFFADSVSVPFSEFAQPSLLGDAALDGLNVVPGCATSTDGVIVSIAQPLNNSTAQMLIKQYNAKKPAFTSTPLGNFSATACNSGMQVALVSQTRQSLSFVTLAVPSWIMSYGTYPWPSKFADAELVDVCLSPVRQLVTSIWARLPNYKGSVGIFYSSSMAPIATVVTPLSLFGVACPS